jgi:hypothetical protein
VAASALETGTASCPAGKRVTGGGVSLAQPNNAYDTLLQIMQSAPDSSLGSWRALVFSRDTVTATFSVYAICASAP